MKHYILTLALAASTAHAAIPGVPRDLPSCEVVGSIAQSVQLMRSKGFERSETERRIVGTMSKVGRVPSYATTVIDIAWDSWEVAPNLKPERAGELMTSLCLRK